MIVSMRDSPIKEEMMIVIMNIKMKSYNQMTKSKGKAGAEKSGGGDWFNFVVRN